MLLVFDSVSEDLLGRELRSLVFSAVGVFDPPTALKSKALPGVFRGVFADPNEANAPEPRLKAFDAPTVGEAREVVEGDMALKGFLLLWDEVSPWRLVEGNILSVDERGPLAPEPPVVRESLLELQKCMLAFSLNWRVAGEKSTHLERRVQRLVFSIRNE